MRVHPWELVGVAFAAGALLALGRRNVVVQAIAELVGELAAAALVAHAKNVIEMKEHQPC